MAAKSKIQNAKQVYVNSLSDGVRIVVRKLPPLLDEQDFYRIVDKEGPTVSVINRYYVAGKYREGSMDQDVMSRCYFIMNDESSAAKLGRWIGSLTFKDSKEEEDDDRSNEGEELADRVRKQLKMSRRSKHYTPIVEKALLQQASSIPTEIPQSPQKAKDKKTMLAIVQFREYLDGDHRKLAKVVRAFTPKNVKIRAKRDKKARDKRAKQVNQRLKSKKPKGGRKRSKKEDKKGGKAAKQTKPAKQSTKRKAKKKKGAQDNQSDKMAAEISKPEAGKPRRSRRKPKK